MGRWLRTGLAAMTALWVTGCGGVDDCDGVGFRHEPRCELDAVAPVASSADETPASEPVVAPPVAATPVKEDLLHRRFVLRSFDEREFAGEHDGPSLEFLEGFRIAGKTCNQFSGPATLENGVLKCAKMVSTMRMCVRPELNELEKTFNAMLTAGATLTLEGDGGQYLRLRQGGHELLYVRADWVR